MTGGLTDDMVFYYCATGQTGALSLTVNGVTTPAQWINSTPPGHRCMTFGYTLFPGAGDPAKLPTQATLTLLLRLTAGWKGPLAAPSRPFPAGIPRQPRIPCGSFPERAQNFLIFCSFPWKTVDKPGFPRYTNRAALNGSKCAQKRHPRQRARNEGVEIRE